MKLVINLEGQKKGDGFKVYLVEEKSNESVLYVKDIEIIIRRDFSKGTEKIKFDEFLDCAYESKKLKDSLLKFLQIEK